ncbi:nucleoside permease [Eudoraea chungangensis]|uniref:nucleoside permease n=1 Tax=Eudoraea chungangensis TaxID=1481905 RepID=UPI0023ED1A3E|nr:nucleoside permease [Eudoraea chungangensis]
MNKRVQFQLSLMMFLEFFVWGSWFVTMGIYLPNTLGASDPEIAMAYSTQSWGAIIAPFIIGLIADRYFNAEKILGVLHLLGGALMIKLAFAESFIEFYPFILAYMILYMPTLALVNSVSFNQMDNPAKQFSFVRVYGTIGWIVAGITISYLFNWDSVSNVENGALRNTFLMCALASGILGFFSFTLPKTPPTVKSQKTVSVKQLFGLDALQLLKDRNFAVFFIASVLICIPLAFYYQHAGQFLGEIGVENPAGKMTIGQVSEILFMLLLPYFFKKYGFKKTIIVAMLAWTVRYLCFAFGNAGDLSLIILIGIGLHGICYDFFFVSGQIYTDSKAGLKYKSSAQGLITLATYGVGMLIGFWVAGRITNYFVNSAEGHDWEVIWIYPAAFALLVSVLFAILFKNEKIEYKT